MMDASNLVWLDLEMTGLDADKERIIEAAYARNGIERRHDCDRHQFKHLGAIACLGDTPKRCFIGGDG